MKLQIELVEENCDLLKEGTKICADSGYYCLNNILFLNHKGLDQYIPEQKEITKTATESIEDNKFDISNFGHDEENDIFMCSIEYKINCVRAPYPKQAVRQLLSVMKYQSSVTEFLTLCN
jgi:transposase